LRFSEAFHFFDDAPAIETIEQPFA